VADPGDKKWAEAWSHTSHNSPPDAETFELLQESSAPKAVAGGLHRPYRSNRTPGHSR